MNHTGNEFETKILDTTAEKMLPKLTALGFQRYFEGGKYKAQWLVNPFNGEKIRVREEKRTVKVEHKKLMDGGNSELKAFKETGFIAKDFNAVIETLLMVGLERVGLPSVKLRVSYVLNLTKDDRVRIDFDTYSELMGKNIPEFMEIEASTSERVYEYVDKLGFNTSDCRNYGPKELFAYYYPDEPII